MNEEKAKRKVKSNGARVHILACVFFVGFCIHLEKKRSIHMISCI